MKSIKPLNDRIKRLQKFTTKGGWSVGSGGSGVKDNSVAAGGGVEGSGGFDKKSGSSQDLKSMNLAACRIGQPCVVTEVVTDTDPGLKFWGQLGSSTTHFSCLSFSP